MLTIAAQEDHAWCGFDMLRRVLSQERRELENGMYPRSTSDAVVDEYRRYCILGELVVKHRDTLARRLAQEDDQSAHSGEIGKINVAMNELDQLRGVLQSLAERLDRTARSVQSVQEQVRRSR